MTLALVKPKPIIPSNQAPATYAALADELGFSPFPGGIETQKLQKFMLANGIPIYDGDEVNAYMDKLAVSVEKDWVWRPLRQRDALRDGWTCRSHMVREFSHSFGRGRWWENLLCLNSRETPQLRGGYSDGKTTPYRHPVPLSVLRDVKTIQSEFSDAQFYVSDYEVPHPDPFISVGLVGVAASLTVFGVWDEPGFGE